MTNATTATTAHDPSHTYPWIDGYPLVGQSVMARIAGWSTRCIVVARYGRHLDPNDVEIIGEDTDEVTILDRGDLRPV